MSQLIAFSNKSSQGKRKHTPHFVNINTIDLDLDNLNEIYLPCPRSNRRSVYFTNDKGSLYEIQKVTGPGRKSTWFIDSFIYKGNINSYDANCLLIHVQQMELLDSLHPSILCLWRCLFYTKHM
jgi:hypothetical protein